MMSNAAKLRMPLLNYLPFSEDEGGNELSDRVFSKLGNKTM